MSKRLKYLILHGAKWTGIFALARRLTSGQLRILCYHGLSLGDEHRFRPGLFMRPEVLRRRLRVLRSRGFPVLSLDCALERMEARQLPPCATVVTFDDGFFSNLSPGLAILKEFDIPATIYVTTYYAAKGQPVFRLVVQYLFWKTRRTEFDLTGLGLGREGAIALGDSPSRDAVMWEIIHTAESGFDEDQRQALTMELAERLDVPIAPLAASRSLHLMTPDEIREIAGSGVDIQLHTHRHRLPCDREVTEREIRDNRAVLEGILGGPRTHLCYPSGEWSREQWPWLEAVSIRSGVTCDPGLNDADTPRLGLSRFLDADNLSQIEFESEIYGLSEILRRFRSRLRRLIPKLRSARPFPDGPGKSPAPVQVAATQTDPTLSGSGPTLRDDSVAASDTASLSG
jgi:peptidoglycan/xylan/chitin deacetylase (PgdA/CDA1 family)